MTDRLLTREELAEKLGHTVAWTYRNLSRLVDAGGFPKPVLANRWSEAAIDAWAARQSSGGSTPVPDDWAARLDRRAAALANQTA